MNQVVTCGRCREVISSDRVKELLIVCKCGAFYSRTEKALEQASPRRHMFYGLLMAALLFGALHQVRTYDTHFIEVIPYQVKALIKMDTKSDNLKVATMCLEVKNYKCNLQQLKNAYSKDPLDMLVMEELGTAHFKLKDYQASVDVFTEYFNKKGKSPDAGFVFAQSLEATNQDSKARRMYNWTIRQKPGVLQVTVTEKFIKLLIKNGKMNMAKKLIRFVQKNSSRTADFMQAELRVIKKSRRKVASR